MFTEILKVKPRIEGGDLNAMERTLNTRFNRVAKKFGSGLVNMLKGTAVVAAISFLVDRLLNPLKEVQEVLDRTLSRGNDLSTYAKQFNTTAGNLARLQAFGQASGLDAEGVRTLLGKFQAAVANAAADPSKVTAVSAYVGKTDTAEAFFEFIQAMQKLPSDIHKNLVQQEVFGEKQILKASEFLNANFTNLALQLKGPSAEALTNAAEYLASQNSKREIRRASRDLEDLPRKAQIIAGKDGRGKMVDMIDVREQMDLARENDRLGRYQSLAKIQVTMDKIADLIEKEWARSAGPVAEYLPRLATDVEAGVNILRNSRTLRGIIGLPPRKDK